MGYTREKSLRIRMFTEADSKLLKEFRICIAKERGLLNSYKPSESTRIFDKDNVTLDLSKVLGGYHLWQSQDDNSTASRELTNKKGKLPMGSVSYSAHISNGKSAIGSKSKLAGVAKHNLRKYKSDEYSSENIELIFGTKDLYKDVQKVYYEEFDEIIREYNEKQTRADRRIDNYFEHVAKLDQDMAVEIIFQCGDKNFWEEHTNNRDKMFYVFSYLLAQLQEQLPDFKVANAVIHFDEASPHMHVVGVPIGYGAKRGLSKKVSKRNVFTPETLSKILQGSLREETEKCFKFNMFVT